MGTEGEAKVTPEGECQLDTVMGIARAVGSTLHIDALLQVVMDKVTTLVDADRSTLYIVDRERGELWSKVVQGEEMKEIHLRIGEGIAGWVAEAGEPILLEDAYRDPRFDRTWDQTSGYHTRSLMCIPLRNKDDRVVAVFQCLNKASGFFTDHDQDLLSAVGGQVGVAIENAFLYEELLARNEALRSAEAQLTQANSELEILYDVEQRTSRSRDVEDLVRVALQRVCHHLTADASAILLDAGDAPRVYSYATKTATLQQRSMAVPIAHTLLERLHVPMRIPREVLEVEKADSLAGATEGVEIREVLSTGLSVHGRTIGVLQVVNHGLGDEVGDGLLRMVALIGAQVARSIELQRARTAEEQARRLSLLGQAVSAILHDLRTPMAAVDGYAALMVDAEDAAEREDLEQRIRRALEHMETMTREVLDFARGDRDILTSKVHLNQFIGEARELLEPELDQCGVELLVEDRYRGTARFDRWKVMRVVTNLARNACQAMTGGGVLVWTVDRDDHGVVMEFADTGAGIPEEMQGRLFEFFATHGKEEGTGIGLAMCKRILDAHGGTIECVESTPKGSTFRVRLPP
jgi:signal transduction histidine kinase